MKVKNHNEYRLFEYENIFSDKDEYQLGDIVCKKPSMYNGFEAEVGVIIQVYNEEFRTDMFGNCSTNEIRLATIEEIEQLYPKLLNDLI